MSFIGIDSSETYSISELYWNLCALITIQDIPHLNYVSGLCEMCGGSCDAHEPNTKIAQETGKNVKCQVSVNANAGKWWYDCGYRE